MKIMIIRHADPNYEIDGLTQQGLLEAKALKERMYKTKIDYVYCSPLGRAKQTCQISLEGRSLEVETKQWLREFEGKAIHPEVGLYQRSWDYKPLQWMFNEEYFDKDKWINQPDLLVKEEYAWVINNFDNLLEKHGYKRFKGLYKAINANDDTLVFYCHFGLECVLLSHLLNISPMVLWHNFCAAPSSVTVLYTEERDKGIANFRMSQFGDVSHLYAAGLEPSFSARFCERYIDFDQRHSFL